jgi:tRNA(Ile)-lysidine synthase
MAPIEHWAGQDGRAQLTVVRPLLLESRQDLLDLVEARGFPYLIDPTNADRDKSRNAIRHDVLPVLERIHAGAGAAIARFAEIARADHLALQDEAAVAESRHIKDGKLMIADFRAVPTAIQRRIIRSWVKSRTGLDLPWNRTEAIRDATLVDRGGTIVELGEHWVARRAGKSIRISRSGER